ncbi:MAG: hypothetical protein M1467_03105 [Deltaproteobacteria bacterium]|jgi:hypothetical protein|nr:hypothetical protein [Deltaproteobacteria bacterium]
MTIIKIKAETEAEKKQARVLRAREEEREVEKNVNQSLKEMDGRQREIFINNFFNRMPNIKEKELKKSLAEIAFRAFVFERILFADKDKYPNLYKEYKDKNRI